MPVLLSCYRRGSYWKVTRRVCRPAGYPRRYRQNAPGMQLEERELASSAPGSSESGDSSSISLLPKQRITACWWSYSSVLAVAGKQSNVDPVAQPPGDSLYRKEWLGDHKQILAALTKKMPERRSWQCGSIWRM